ncbi:hypothetical protein PTKIN_Ptkin14bG0064300 [Pterospermum kingtungense]
MDPLSAVILETSRCIASFICSSIATIAKLHHNTKGLRDDIDKLGARKNGIEDDVRLAETEGKCATAQVQGWLRKVEEIEQEVHPMLDKADRISVQGCSPCCNIVPRYLLSRRMAKQRLMVKQLIDSCNFDTVFINKKSPVRAVEKQQGPSLAGQREAEEMMDKLMELLKGDQNKRIAVWGMGGVGKTTLVRNLNNKLESSSLMEELDIVIWVTVSKDLDLKRVQSQIAKRLNLESDANESVEERANMLLKRLMKKKFLLILDDVWGHIDLNIVGVPQGDHDQTTCKILLTTRSLDVCRAMMTNEEIKMDVLHVEAAWNLFAQSAGDVVEIPGIYPLARAVARECSGLPLALKTFGKSMRNRRRIELWKHALRQLQCSSPHDKSIEDEVYLPLMLSYNSLPSKILKSCFSFCSLYPENYSIRTNELIQCWIADKLIYEHQSLEDCYNEGIALIETLKDSCLLEHGQWSGTVKLHDVVRDLAIWISTKQGSDESCTRISFSNITKLLPKQLSGFSELTVLFLVGNPINKIHDNLFGGLTKLRVLNLSQSHIASLPPSLSQLRNLRALLLRDCCYLEKLPSLGALYKLQVIDLSGTGLRELPNGTSKLNKLRELRLSRTHHLETIEAGTISGLLSLESLDMCSCAYKWDARCNVEEGRAAFDEILTLEKLSVLKIRLDKVDSLALDAAWLKRLREFNIQISPGSCDSSHMHTQHEEKRVILRGVDLMGRGLNGLLCTASSLDLVICGGMSALSELAVDRSLSGLKSLKSLTISKCNCITHLISGENISGTILPNLEHLSLSRLENLKEILGGMVPRRGCLGSLKTIEVGDCKKLKSLIPFALLQQVKNLEEIKVKNCRKMKCIISGKVSAKMIPKLRVIELRDLTMLKSICSRVPAWPALEMIKVRNCPMLRKLPFAASNEVNVRELRGDLQWWDNLIWNDDEIKFSDTNHIQPLHC